MRTLLVAFSCFVLTANSSCQTCDEILEFVESQSYGRIYYSPSSEAIEKVTFYNVIIDYQTFYFAVVCFKGGYFGCTEYIYQVASNTQTNYSMNYLSSAGKAFWSYIQPYNDNLGCAPYFDL